MEDAIHSLSLTALAVLVVTLFFHAAKYNMTKRLLKQTQQELRETKLKLEDTRRKLDEILQSFPQKVMEEASKLASKQYREWIEKEKEQIRKEYELKFHQWIQEKEKEIRKDAINRSVITILGKIAEQVAPLIVAVKYGINPKDLRFLGTPIDYIGFKGLSDGNPEEIIFIEIKNSTKPSLNEREKAIKKLIEEKKVVFKTFNVKAEIRNINNLVKQEIEKELSQATC